MQHPSHHRRKTLDRRALATVATPLTIIHYHSTQLTIDIIDAARATLSIYIYSITASFRGPVAPLVIFLVYWIGVPKVGQRRRK